MNGEGEYPDFRCPITMDIMRDTDGHTAIVQALAVKPVSPLTRQPQPTAPTVEYESAPRQQTVNPQSPADYRRGCVTLIMFVLVVFIVVVWMAFVFH